MENWFNIVADKVNNSKNKVVEVDVINKSVKYSENLKSWRDIDSIASEEYVRAFLINRLCNELGYNPELIEIELEYEAGRPKVIKPRIDLILKNENGEPFFYIEIKAPNEFEKSKDLAIKNQLFSLVGLHQAKYGQSPKYLVYYTIHIQDNEIRDNAVIIDYQKFNTYNKWEEENYPSCGRELTANFGIPKSQPYIRKVYDLSIDFDKETMSSLATDLHNVLWGGGGTSDNDIFNSLVNIILAKIKDEYDTKDFQEYQFQVLEFDGKDENEDKVFTKINDLYQLALEDLLNNKDEDKRTKNYVVNLDKFSINKFIYTVKRLQGFSFLQGREKLDGKDLLGDFFEEITRTGFNQNKGQFFTPINIVKFILYALQVDRLAIDLYNKENRLPYIIDPTCGSGTFMIEVMKMITKEMWRKQYDDVDTTSYRAIYRIKELFPDHAENIWAREYLYASDFNFDLGTSAKVNMILHGDGSMNVFIKDGLSPFANFLRILQAHTNDENYNHKEVNNQFDILISNPPFSVAIDNKTQKGLSDRFLFATKKNSENLFIERYYQLLKPNGRLGVVLPESVFDTTENKYIRLFLFKYFVIKAVVSIPQLTFEPHTSTKTSLFFAQKKTAKQIKEWSELWNTIGNEWSKLKTRIASYIAYFVEEKELNKRWAEDVVNDIENENFENIKTNIYRFLKNYIVESDNKLEIKDLLIKYKEEIQDTSHFDKDLTDYFGFYNSFWVFSEIVKTVDYPIFMSEANNIGYKRTKRGEKPMPNDLFDTEIAPHTIDKDKILLEYSENIQIKTKLKTELEKEIEITEQNISEKETKNLQKHLEKLTSRFETVKTELETLIENEKTAKEVFKTYYKAKPIPKFEKLIGKYELKPEYHDRTDETLLSHFSNGIFQPYKSDDVLIRKEQIIKILDAIRKEVKW